MLEYSNTTDTPKSAQKKNALVRLHHFILNKTSALLELPQTQKAQFVNLFCAFTCVCQLITITLLLQFDLPKEHALHPLMHEHGIGYLIISFVFYMVMMSTGFLIPKGSLLIRNTYCFFSLLAYGIGALIITYFLGFLSIATGVTLMMSPLLGLILFRNTLVLWVTIFIVPLAITLFVLVATSIIPYTILLATTDSMHNNLSMQACLYGSGTPFLVTSLFIAYACIERWKQRERFVHQLSTQDPLTLLANRTVFLEHIQAYISRPRMHRKSISLMMLDLDNFKQINDEFGHLVGDEVLRNIANTLSNTVRKGDIVARYGGEEFCILLPDTPQDTAEAIAQRILTAIKDTVTEKQGHRVSVTTSIGITTADSQHLNSPKLNINALLGAIDQGMYAAKDRGKNTLHFMPLQLPII